MIRKSKEDRKMSCLLGVVDSRILHEEGLSWDTNKIGGGVILPADIKPFSHPSCRTCGRRLCLVVQLYCPLEYSTYHRVLFVFACGNQQCWNKSDSWVVYRCQTIDQSIVKTKEPHTGNKLRPATDDWGVADTDDWGTDGANDWGAEGSDNWGAGADDWGMEGTEDMTSQVDIGEKKNGESACSSEINTRCPESVPSSAETYLTGDITDNMPLQQMNLHDPESDNDNTDSSHVITEDNHKVDIDRNQLKRLCEVPDSSESSHALIAYYLNVFDEPANQEEDGRHVTKLLRDYEKKEGCRVYDAEYSTESGKKGQGEGYERTSVYHRDLVFHKFMKKVSLCPHQCIRYEWNGTPLLMRELPPKEPVTRCQHCGGEMVFEFQLMPSLVNYLKTVETAGAVVEFGTVLVFTCKQSCWEDRAGFRTEQVIVQADPDQELFS